MCKTSIGPKQPMALEVGSRLGHYDVIALIGEGGMGQVYQATETKLNWQVALKILPEAFAADPDRLGRRRICRRNRPFDQIGDLGPSLEPV